MDNYEDYESEGHYEIVDETIINGNKDEERAETIDNPDGPPVQPIYATVNKKKKQQPQVCFRSLKKNCLSFFN